MGLRQEVNGSGDAGALRELQDEAQGGDKTVKASRQDMRRAIDFSAVRDPDSIITAIAALLNRRSNVMREKEIAAWFRGTPKAFITQSLAAAVDRGFIKAGGSSLSRNRRVLVYWTGAGTETKQ